MIQLQLIANILKVHPEDINTNSITHNWRSRLEATDNRFRFTQ